MKKKVKEITLEGAEQYPVKFEYEKNIRQPTDFVPFDYSKADLRKFLNCKLYESIWYTSYVTNEPI